MALPFELRRLVHEACLDPQSGEIHPVVIVSDDGSAYRSTDFLRFIASRPELSNVRNSTRIRAGGSGLGPSILARPNLETNSRTNATTSRSIALWASGVLMAITRSARC